MGCTKAQLVALISYIENECMEAGSYDKCMQIIRIVKRKAELNAINEVVPQFFN